MNEDIRISTTFFSHRKTKKLQKILGDHGVVCLIRLWTRIAVEKPCGVLVGWNSDDIEIEADFHGDDGAFVSGLIETGFLEKVEDGAFTLHNWDVRQAWVVNAQERSDKARMSRMARTHPAIYAELQKDGCTGVTRKQYNSLTKVQRPVNDSLTREVVALTPAPAPAPAPDPDPVPDPAPSVGAILPPEKNPVTIGEVKKNQPCPQLEIVDLYNSILGDKTPPVTPKLWTKARRKVLADRWKEDVDRQGIKWWSDFFKGVRECPFLIGEKTDWRANLDWLIKPSNMIKVLEGKYNDRPSGKPRPYEPKTIREAQGMQGSQIAKALNEEAEKGGRTDNRSGEEGGVLLEHPLQ